MAKRKRPVVLTYNGLDGACAAAMVLLKHPRAELSVTSAAGVGEAFRGLAKEAFSEVHVCGLGIWCPWDELLKAAAKMKKAGTRIYWYCGRGYLDDERARFGEFCEPVFIKSGTNTAAVMKHHGLTEQPEAAFLASLAWFDAHVAGSRKAGELSPEQEQWVELVEASLAQYFKYQDREPYLRAIRQMPRGVVDAQSRELTESFRRTGYRYVLHGRSPAMGQLKRRILQCADADRHVLITGESGVGKENVAHLLRERSPRSMGPFIPVNCALYAGSASLANSDLFGHKKGAFTGAEKNRAGRFAGAHRGILYLDEIGELPLEVQAKLLRVLEDGWVTPEGADMPESQVDVRIIAATNRELPRLIREGLFRADLYHRLATLRIHVPPLRERPEDIKHIVRQRLALLAGEGHEAAFGKNDFAVLQRYEWPGNVRQLIKLIERAVLLEMDMEEAVAEETALGELTVYDSEISHEGGGLSPATRSQVIPMAEVKRRYAQKAWELHGRNYSATARALGVKANTLRYSYLGDEET